MTESCHIPIFLEVKEFFYRQNSVHIFIYTCIGMGEHRGPKQNDNKQNNDDGEDEVVLVVVIPALSALRRRQPGVAVIADVPARLGSAVAADT